MAYPPDEEIGEQEQEIDYAPGGLMYLYPGMRLDKRYWIIRKLGWGNFSTVWLGWHSRSKKFVAIKVVKSDENYAATARLECQMLEKIDQRAKRHHTDPGSKRVVNFIETFDVLVESGKHVCIVTEVLGDSLLTAINRKEGRNGLPLELIKKVSRQLLEGLSFLHNRCHIMHTDIKLENVLFLKPQLDICYMALKTLDKLKNREPLPLDSICITAKPIHAMNPDILRITEQIKQYREKLLIAKSRKNEDPESVKIVDLGNAISKELHSPDIQTLQYQSPEVILGLPYDGTADIWSAACTIFEAATAFYLFDPHRGQRGSYTCQKDHLALMIELLGQVPDSYRNAPKYEKYFDKSGHFKSCNPAYIKMWPLPEMLTQRHGWEERRAVHFARFLLPMLRWDPTARLTAAQCLQSRWLKD